MEYVLGALAVVAVIVAGWFITKSSKASNGSGSVDRTDDERQER